MNVLTNKTVKSSNYYSRYNGNQYYTNTLDVLSQDRVTGAKSYKEQMATAKWLSHADNTYELYTVKEGDTYDSIALVYYNNPTYYWVICDFNRVLDSLQKPVVGSTLLIPSMSGGLVYEEY